MLVVPRSERDGGPIVYLTQGEVCDATGMRRMTINRWEKAGKLTRANTGDDMAAILYRLEDVCDRVETREQLQDLKAMVLKGIGEAEERASISDNTGYRKSDYGYPEALANLHRRLTREELERIFEGRED